MKYFSLRRNKALAVSSLLLATFAVPAVHAKGVSVGLGVAATTDFYKNYKHNVVPLPMVNYEGDKFFISGFGGGYKLWQDNHHRLAITAGYSWLEFKPKDTKNRQLKQLNKRRATMLVGIDYQLSTEFGAIKTALAFDSLGKSKGVIADLGYLYPITLNRLTVTPGFGVKWASKRQNRYYVGVKQNEANRSGLDRYNPSDSWSPYAKLTTNYAINDSWDLSFFGQLTLFSKEIKNSPMVAKKYNTLIGTSISYTF